MLVPTCDVDKSTVLLDCIPGLQPGHVDTFMLLVRSPQSDGGLIVDRLDVHSAGLMQLYTWKMKQKKREAGENL